MVAQPRDPRRQVLVVGGHRAGVAEGAEVLARIEAERRQAPEGTGPPRLGLVRQDHGGALERPLQRPGVHAAGRLVHVDEARPGAGVLDRLGGRREGVGHRHHVVARPDSQRQQAEVQSRRPRGDADRPADAAELGHRPLERGHLRPADERAAADHAGDGRVELVALPPPGRDHVHQRNGHLSHR